MRTLAGSRRHNVAMVTSHLTRVALTTSVIWGRDCRISPTRRTPESRQTRSAYLLNVIVIVIVTYTRVRISQRVL